MRYLYKYINTHFWPNSVHACARYSGREGDSRREDLCFWSWLSFSIFNNTILRKHFKHFPHHLDSNRLPGNYQLELVYVFKYTERQAFFTVVRIEFLIPSTARDCCSSPLLGPRGRHTRLRRRRWVDQILKFRRSDRHSGTLCKL